MRGIAVDARGRCVYGTDAGGGLVVHAWKIDQTTGDLTHAGSVPTATSAQDVTTDLQGKFVYTITLTGASPGTVTTYSIDQSTCAITFVSSVVASSIPRGIVVSR